MPRRTSTSAERPDGRSLVIDRALAAAREELGMEAAHVSEFSDGEQVFRRVLGGESFGLEEGAGLPLDGTFCQRMTREQIASVIPDARANPDLAGLPVTSEANIGAYVGVPLRLPDGTLYGSFCCMSHEADPSLAERDIRFMHVLARMVGHELERERRAEEDVRRLGESLVERTSQARALAAGLEIAQAETVRRLSLAVEYRDDETGSHVDRVSRLCSVLASLAGLDATLCELIRHASGLHDAGKIAVPDAVLLKPGRLTPEERAVIETHPEVGHELLGGSDSEVLQMAATIAWSHHERFDGAGYPRGLAGEEIPVEGRLLAIVDVYDALSNDRVYRPAFPRERVVEIMLEGRGSQFDPALLDLFLEAVQGGRLAAADQTPA